MSLLEILLWLELLRQQSEHVKNLQAGVASLRSEFPNAFGCDPNGNCWVGYQMPSGWEEELESKWQRIQAKWNAEQGPDEGDELLDV